ncbi:MAG: hypothetical protein Q8T09_06235 [Candidatus Melainabacteria bacterium]|nr:hypothetical protein [Candidatus Melainabacteria bacterium]
MSKYIRFLEKYFLISSALALSLAFISRVLRQLYWHELVVSQLTNYIIPFVFIGAVGLFFSRTKSVAFESGQLWSYLSAEYPFLPGLRAAFRAVVLVFLAGSAVFSTSLVWLYGGTVLAYGCDSIHQFELAERIFCATGQPGDPSFSTLSGRGYVANHIHGQDLKDFELAEDENRKLDLVVANVYGPTSRQMAHRYMTHAFRLESNFDNFQLASTYLKRALAIYKLHNDPERCLKILGFLSFSQVECKQVQDLQNSLHAAFLLTRECHYSQSSCCNFLWVRSNAEAAGIDVNRVDLAVIGPKAGGLVAREVDDYPPILQTVAIGALLILLIFRGKKLILSGARNRWLCDLAASVSIPGTVEILDRLVVLELFNGNLTKADEYSRKSLELATSWKT